MTHQVDGQKWDEEEIALPTDNVVRPDLIESILYTMNRIREVSPEAAPKEDMIILVAPDIGSHVHIRIPVSQPAYVMLQPEIDKLEIPPQELHVPDISDEVILDIIKERKDNFDKVVSRGMRKVLVCGGMGMGIAEALAAMPTPVDLTDVRLDHRMQPWHDRGGKKGKGGKIGYPNRGKCTNNYRGRGRKR